jgi:hypothetical protein
MNTRLVDYYDALHDLTDEEVTALAKFHAEDPSLLIRRFLKSVETVQRRDAIDEPFHGKRKEHPAAERVEIRRTIDLVTHLRGRVSCEVKGEKALDFRYVDYEIFPAREIGTEEPEPRRSTDLLLANEQDRTPVVAELKIGGDKPAYFALVQALMLAAEFQSAGQRARLKKHYPSEKLNWEDEGPYVDIYLLVFEAPATDNRQHSFQATKQISERLVENARFAQVVRRIAYLKGTVLNNSVAFEKIFAFGRGL